jgi:hypothetical protein
MEPFNKRIHPSKMFAKITTINMHTTTQKKKKKKKKIGLAWANPHTRPSSGLGQVIKRNHTKRW